MIEKGDYNVKKILMSKKLLLALNLTLVAVLALGATYAWFSSQVKGANNVIEMGRLSIGATFDVNVDEDLYEPGLDVVKDGTVSNQGTLAFIAKVDLDGTVTIRSDDSGNPLSYSYEIPISAVNGIDVGIDEDCLGYRYDSDGSAFVWMTDPATGDLYILMDGSLTADANFAVNFDGSLGNLYQGASVNYAKGWLATQVSEGAILEYFGVDYTALEPIGNNDFSTGPSGRSVVTNLDRALAHFNALLAE